MQEPISVAVIGLGAAGLVALKNLKEEGYDVTGFDRNDYIGGLWKYSNDDQTSVLQTTVVNISRQRGCFTDFPFPDLIDNYPTAAQVHEYLLSYAKHFNLKPHFHLNAPVQKVIFDDSLQKWAVEIKNQNPHYFDKVVIAIGGMTGLPNMPNIEGLSKFAGTNIHAQSFKRPQDFTSKRVVVIGFGNSAADTATQLAPIASKVYLAHRHGARILPRSINNRPADHAQNLRLFTIQTLLTRFFPLWSERQFDAFLKRLQNKCFTLDPSWRFEPAQKVPIVSDTLVPCLENRSIESTHGVKRITSGCSIELDDGTELHDIDALIWCTGYKSDFSILDSRFDPSVADAGRDWTEAKGSNGKNMFNLWHNVFSVEKPDSLAFLGNVQWATSGFHIFDWASMAVAQVWKRDPVSALPSLEQMRMDVEKHHTWLAGLASRGYNVSPGSVDPGTWTRAMDELGGTGVQEYLGYGWKGWWFWLMNWRLCNLLMGGIWSPHIYRVFDGKRKKWDGAREAIEKVNRSADKNKEKAKEN